MAEKFRINYTVAQVVTPMKADGAVDVGRIPHYARLIHGRGTRAVFVNGTMSEFSSLTCAERNALAAAWLETKATVGMQMVMIHVGGCCLPECLEMASHAKAGGADAICVLPPFYLQPGSIDDCVTYVATIAGVAPGLPLYYNHVTCLTHTALDISGLIRAMQARIPTFRGIKFTSTNGKEIAECARLVQELPGELEVVCGWDAALPPLQAAGFKHGILMGENVIGDKIAASVAALEAGDTAAAKKHQAQIVGYFETLHRHAKNDMVRGYKAVFKMMGPDFDMGPCRAPLYPYSDGQCEELKKELVQQGFL